MMQAKLKPAYILSIIIAILAAMAATGGLFLGDMYRDNIFVSSVWRGNDLVTLVVGIGQDTKII